MYHGTSEAFLDSILSEGLRVGTFLTASIKLATVYAKLYAVGVVLKVPTVPMRYGQTLDIIHPDLIQVHIENLVFVPVDFKTDFEDK